MTITREWQKSPYSGLGNCAEVCLSDDGTVIRFRESTLPDTIVEMPIGSWNALVDWLVGDSEGMKVQVA